MTTAQEFDPLKHRRGAHGKFTDMLRAIKPGSAVQLPDGIHVKAVNAKHGQGRRRKYQVIHANGKKVGGDHLEAETAAISALNASAQNVHPDAVGGKQHFENYSHAMGEGQHAAEAAGGGAAQRIQQNAAELRRTYDPNPNVALRKVKAERERGQLPRFQANALIAHINAEIALQKREQRQPVAKDVGMTAKRVDDEGYHKQVDAFNKKALELRGAKPRAEHLTPGQTKLTHSQHGEMIYMGRNATNHHVARKVSDGEGGKKHIIRLKEIKLGHGKAEEGAADKASEPKGEPRSEADKAVAVDRQYQDLIAAAPDLATKNKLHKEWRDFSRTGKVGPSIGNRDLKERIAKNHPLMAEGGGPKPGIGKPVKVTEGQLTRSGSDMVDVKSVYKLPDGRVIRQEKEYEPVMEGRIRVGKRTFGTFWYSYASEADAERGTRGNRIQYHSKADAVENKRAPKPAADMKPSEQRAAADRAVAAVNKEKQPRRDAQAAADAQHRAVAGPEAIDKELERMGWFNGRERQSLAEAVDYWGMRGRSKDDPKIVKVGGHQFKLWQENGPDESWSWRVQFPDGKTDSAEQAHDMGYAIADWIGEQKARANLRRKGAA